MVLIGPALGVDKLLSCGCGGAHLAPYLGIPADSVNGEIRPLSKLLHRVAAKKDPLRLIDRKKGAVSGQSGKAKSCCFSLSSCLLKGLNLPLRLEVLSLLPSLSTDPVIAGKEDSVSKMAQHRMFLLCDHR
jgi:hypothetical protein